MTGYLTPPLNLLYPHERLFLQSSYCRICKNLSDRKLILNRIFLNYDSLFFFTLFLSTLQEYNFSITPFFCKFTLTNRFYLSDNGLISYFTDYSTLFSSLKFFDNYKDEKSLISIISLIFYKKLIKSLQFIKDDNSFDNKNNISFNIHLDENTKSELRIANSINDDHDKEDYNKDDFNKNEIFELIRAIENIFPLEYINYLYRENVSTIISNLIKLLFYIDAIDDYEDDLKKNKKNILFYGDKNKNRKLKDNSIVLDKIKSECTFSLNYCLINIEKLPNKNFLHILQVYFTDLIPQLLDKALLKSGCQQIFCKYKVKL